jgi:hypothetical protein
MYYELTNIDFVCVLHDAPDHNALALNVSKSVMQEAARRIQKMEREIIAWHDAAGVVCCDTPQELKDHLHQLPENY